MAGTASRSSRRAAAQAADTTPAVSAVSDASAEALHELLHPERMPSAPIAPEPAPTPAPEPTYSLEIRLASPALSGDSAYHVTWPASRIRALLAGKMDWIPAPVRAHLPGQAAPNAVRYVYIQNIAEIIIHGWPQEPVD